MRVSFHSLLLCARARACAVLTDSLQYKTIFYSIKQQQKQQVTTIVYCHIYINTYYNRVSLRLLAGC